MADKVIAARLQLDGADKAGESVKSFKTELREATQQVITLSEKFGATSKEAVTAAKSVANLRDRIADAKGLSDAFNPDAKFRAFSNAISGVVGGFSGLTGAMALFGGQSKDVEAALLKVQAAMALSQGVNSILESKDAFIALGAKIKDIGIFQKANALANQLAAGTMKLFGISVETSSTAFKVLKGAIAATGIGLLVVALGEAVSAFQSFTSSSEKAKEAQQKFNDATKEGADIALKIETDSIRRHTDIDVAKAKLAGASEKDIFDIQQNGLRNRAKALQRHFDEIKNLTDKANTDAAAADIAAINDINNQGTLAKINFDIQEKKRLEDAAKERQAANKQAAKDNAARLKKEKEDAAELAEFNKGVKKAQHDQDAAEAAQFVKEDEAAKAAAAKLIEDNEKTRLNAKQKLAELNVIDNPDSPAAKIEKIKADLDLELSTLAEGDLQRQVLTRQSEEAITAIEKDESEKRKKEREAEFEAKLSIQNAELNTLSQFGGLLQQIAGKNKAVAATGIIVENAAAIARIVVNTAAANAKAVAQFPLTLGQPWVAINTISAGLGIASSILATKKALATIGGGGSTGSAPTLSQSATGGTAAPLQPQVQSTLLNQDQLNNSGSAVGKQPPIQAFVVESQGATIKEREERLRRAAVLGGG